LIPFQDKFKKSKQIGLGFSRESDHKIHFSAFVFATEINFSRLLMTASELT